MTAAPVQTVESPGLSAARPPTRSWAAAGLAAAVPAVASSGLMLVAVAGLLGSGLTTEFGRGERLDFDTWAREHRPALLRTALGIARDRDGAEDLVQATLTKVYLAWDRVRDQGALDGYVRRVMVNTQRTWWRRGWRRLEVASGTDVAADTASRDDGFVGVEARDELAPLLRALPEHQRAALVLRYLRDRSVDETAALLGLSTGTVKSQTSRGIAAMRRLSRPLSAAA